MRTTGHRRAFTIVVGVALTQFLLVGALNGSAVAGNGRTGGHRHALPFIVFGFTYDPGPDTPWKGQQQALGRIGDAGFNFMQTPVTRPNRDAFFEQANYMDVGLIVDTLDTPLEWVRMFSDRPGVAGWNIADEANNNYRPKEIKELNDRVRRADPNHFTYLTLAANERMAGYMNAADVIGVESFPIKTDESRQPLWQVYYDIRTATSLAADYDRPVIANLQTFETRRGRYPRPAEVYNMTYQALLPGADGVLYHTYRDDENFIQCHEKVWADIARTVPEVAKLTPVLKSGDPRQIRIGRRENLLAGAWTYERRVYLVVLNTSYQRARVSFEMTGWPDRRSPCSCTGRTA